MELWTAGCWVVRTVDPWVAHSELVSVVQWAVPWDPPSVEPLVERTVAQWVGL